ncbi:MAG: molybdopterin-dependent oxidoreductase, partial [Coriobacteriales bacterium]|nr:molybdopterin-dependent oxidoreductase [Coriobacteriales bacterium]
ACFLVVADKEPTGPEAPYVLRGPNWIKTKLLLQSDIMEGGSDYKFMVWDEMSESLKWFNASAPLARVSPYDPALDPECNRWETEEPWPRYDGTGHKDAWARRVYPGVMAEANLRPGMVQGYIPDLVTFDNMDPALYGEYEVTFKDGSVHTAIPVWQLFAQRCDEYAPEKSEAITGVKASLVTEAALAYGARKDPRWGNGGILYQLGLEHHGNGIMSCRAVDTLATITGNSDMPGGQRGPTKLECNWTGNFGDTSYDPNVDMSFGKPIMKKQLGIDKYPLQEWWAMWADANSVWEAGVTGKPYPVKGGVCQSGDFLSMGNSNMAWECLKQLDFFFNIDVWHHPTAELADVIMPAQHWLEVSTPRQSQGSGGMLGACVQCIEPPADTWYDPMIVEAFYKKLGIQWGWDPSNPYPTCEEMLDHVVAEISPSWKAFAQEFQVKGWWDVKDLRPDDWGTYRRYQTGFCIKDYTYTPNASNVVPGYYTPTQRYEIWSTVVETYHSAEDALPDYRPNADAIENNPEVWKEYPVTCLTGRRIPVYFHSEHRQLPWCREVWPAPRVEINPDDAAEWGIEQGDWVWIESRFGKIRETADLFYGIAKGVINCEHTWWYPELSAPEHGWTLSAVNQLVNNDIGDPHCGSAVVRGYPVKVYKCTPENCPDGLVIPSDYDGTPIIHDASDERLNLWLPTFEGRE